MRLALGVGYRGAGLSRLADPARRAARCRTRSKRRCRASRATPVTHRLRRPHRRRRARAEPGRAPRHAGRARRRSRGCAAPTATCPPTSRCSGACRCAGDFHARNSARGRRYAYVLLRVAGAAGAGGRAGRLGVPAARRRRDARGRAAPGRRARLQRASARRECQAPSPVKTLRSIDDHAPRRLLALRLRRQRLPAPHGAQHHGLPGRGGAGARSRRRGWPTCWPRATATPRRRPSPRRAVLPRPVLRCRAMRHRPSTRRPSTGCPDTSRTAMTRIKICGLTREADVDAAVEAGADAIGFVLYAASPRACQRGARRELARRLPPFVTPVVPVRQRAGATRSRLRCAAMPEALLQFHGDETPAQCERRAPALHPRRAHGAGLRFVRLRAAATQAPRPCCSTPMSRATAAAERSSIGHSFHPACPLRSFCLVG